jgi:dephospho-CoA kinase
MGNVGIKLVTITGNIATGKSFLSKMIEGEFGFFHISADQIGHIVLEQTDVIEEIKEYFPSSVINGCVDRRALGKIVFSDDSLRERLNSITHPRIREATDKIFKVKSRSGAKVVFEHPLLFELNLEDIYRPNILTICGKQLQIERLIKRNDLTEEEALERIDAQRDWAEKVASANLVIDTSEDVNIKTIEEFLQEHGLI